MSMYRLPPWVRKHFLTISFLAGFATDLILLDQVEDTIDNLILLFYVTLATVALLTLYMGVAERAGVRTSRFFRSYSPMAIQYAFGGLLSGMLIFYGRSGDWLASWPFLLLIALAILGNELVRNRAQRLVFHLSVYFIGVFSYIVLVVSVFSGRTEPWVFYSSGALALLVVYVVTWFLYLVIPNFIRLQLRNLIFSVGCIYITLNALYATSVLPPIPLSLKEITIAHTVTFFRESREYHITYEPIPAWRVWERFAPTLHIRDTQTAACFTKIFAPTRLQAGVYHQWDFFDPTQNRWVEHFRVPYEVSGAATQGYRGFSSSSNLRDGKWRCTVKNARGQSLGRKVFYIDTTTTPAELVRRID